MFCLWCFRSPKKVPKGSKKSWTEKAKLHNQIQFWGSIGLQFHRMPVYCPTANVVSESCDDVPWSQSQYTIVRLPENYMDIMDDEVSESDLKRTSSQRPTDHETRAREWVDNVNRSF